MYFEHSDRTKEWIGRVSKFMDDHIIPAVPTYEAQQKEGSRWKVIPVVEELKANRPTLEEEQRAGRGLLWDKRIDRAAQAENRASRIRQQAYVYQPKPGRG